MGEAELRADAEVDAQRALKLADQIKKTIDAGKSIHVIPPGGFGRWEALEKELRDAVRPWRDGEIKDPRAVLDFMKRIEKLIDRAVVAEIELAQGIAGTALSGHGQVDAGAPPKPKPKLPWFPWLSQRLPLHDPGHGAQLGFTTGGMKGGGGQNGGLDGSGGGAGSGQGGFGNQNDFGGGFGGGQGAKGGGGSPTPTPDPDKTGPADGGQTLPQSPDSGDADRFAASAGTSAGDLGQTMMDNAASAGADAGTQWSDTSPGEEDHTSDVGSAAWDYLNSSDDSGSQSDGSQQETPDPPEAGGNTEPNPEGDGDESGKMKGLPRRRLRRANRFNNQGYAPAQTSAVFKLLEYASGYIGDDGGGVNPRFFASDPSANASTSRSGRFADPDEGGAGDVVSGVGSWSGGAGGGDSTSGWHGGGGDGDWSGVGDMSSVIGGTATGPDPDNEWGAGGYNPHYQPQVGYTWTPSSRGVVGTTRVAAGRVRVTPLIRFK